MIYGHCKTVDSFPSASRIDRRQCHGCSGRGASNDVEGKSNKLRMCQAKGVAENVRVPGTNPAGRLRATGNRWMDHILGREPKEMISERSRFEQNILIVPISGKQGCCHFFNVSESSTIPESDPVQSFIIPSEEQESHS